MAHGSSSNANTHRDLCVLRNEHTTRNVASSVCDGLALSLFECLQPCGAPHPSVRKQVETSLLFKSMAASQVVGTTHCRTVALVSSSSAKHLVRVLSSARDVAACDALHPQNGSRSPQDHVQNSLAALSERCWSRRLVHTDCLAGGPLRPTLFSAPPAQAPAAAACRCTDQ
jgi:hypothetical protein